MSLLKRMIIPILKMTMIYHFETLSFKMEMACY